MPVSPEKINAAQSATEALLNVQALHQTSQLERAEALEGRSFGNLTIGEGMSSLFPVTDKRDGRTTFLSPREVIDIHDEALMNGLPVQRS